VILEATLDERVENTHQEYIHEALAEHVALYGEDEGFNQWAGYLLTSIDKIKKRLGGTRHVELRQVMENAIAQHRDHGNVEPHREWIRTLLSGYYDPMYDYQIKSNEKQIAFKGDKEAVIDYLEQQGIRYTA
jgi:tRNA 2-selenouridine synthase